MRHIIGCDSRGAVHIERADYLGRHDAPDQALAGRGHEPASGAPAVRPTCSRAPTCSSACRGARVIPAVGAEPHEPRPDRVRDGQPEPRGARPRRRRRTRGSSPPAARTTPTRSTTCSAFPGIFRGALDVRAPRDHRGDEDRRRPRDRRHRLRPTSCARTTSSRRCSTARSSAPSPPRSPRRRARAGTPRPAPRSASPRPRSSADRWPVAATGVCGRRRPRCARPAREGLAGSWRLVAASQRIVRAPNSMLAVTDSDPCGSARHRAQQAAARTTAAHA